MSVADPATNRGDFLARHPHAFFLDADDRPGLSRYLRTQGWIDADESVESATKPGDGNMNCTLRVQTDRRRVIVKQARPWVEKYDHIPAPWDRALVEARFYQAVTDLPGVQQRMPKLLGVDRTSRLLVLEDLGESRDLTDLYTGALLADDELDELVRFLAVLHAAPIESEAHEVFTNREMRALNHEYIFVLPLAREGVVDLEPITPGLTAVAATLRRDAEYGRLVAELGGRYLADGPALLHGDYFPGSWLRTSRGVKVIDPEFCFLGDASFDLGVFAAHLMLADQPSHLPQRLFDVYAELAPGPWGQEEQRRALQFAGVEIMRRLIGVAQLPLTADLARKSDLIDCSRRLVIEPSLGVLGTKLVR